VHAHTREAIRKRLAEAHRPNYLRDWVYGGIDGAVTTFAVVSGVAGAQLSPRIVIIIGLAKSSSGSPISSRWRSAWPRRASPISSATCCAASARRCQTLRV
jgi:hypothetical protein